MSEKVERTGIEPVTSGLQSRVGARASRRRGTTNGAQPGMGSGIAAASAA
jgi:hypothetical protein